MTDKQNEATTNKSDWKHRTWSRVKPGEYVCKNGRCEIYQDDRKWYVLYEGELWGEWKTDFDGRYYKPFRSLNDAIVLLDEYECRGFVELGTFPPDGEAVCND